MKKPLERIIIGVGLVGLSVFWGVKTRDKAREVDFFAALPRLTTDQLVAAPQGTLCRFDAKVDTANKLVRGNYVAFTTEVSVRHGRSSDWEVAESQTPSLQLDCYGQKVQLNSYTLLTVSPAETSNGRIHALTAGQTVGVFGKIGPHTAEGLPTMQGPWYTQPGPMVGIPDTDATVAQMVQHGRTMTWCCAVLALVGVPLLLYSVFRG